MSDNSFNGQVEQTFLAATAPVTDPINRNVDEQHQADADQYGSDITQYAEASGYDAGSHITALPFVKRFADNADKINLDASSETTVQDIAGEITSDIRGLSMDATFFLMDPLGALANAGLTIVLDLVQPLDDLLLAVSGDPGEMQRQIDVMEQIQVALAALADEISVDVDSNLTVWTGVAADAASNELGGLVASARSVSSAAEDIAEMLDWARLTAEAIYAIIKAIIAEFVLWLITRGVVALVTAPFTAGGSVSAFLINAIFKAGQVFQKVFSKFGKAQKVFTKIGAAFAKSVAKRKGWKWMLQLLAKPGAGVAITALGQRDSLLNLLFETDREDVDAVKPSSYAAFDVEVEELRSAAAALENRLPNIDSIESVASEAYAAEMTWGLTGLFFEQPYLEGCTALSEAVGLLGAATTRNVAALRDCANDYEQADGESAGSLEALMVEYE